MRIPGTIFFSEIPGLFANVESKKKKKVYWSGRETEKKELWQMRSLLTWKRTT